MAHLSAAYHGYNHQDVVTAYAFASLLLPRSDEVSVTVDRKVTPNDCFDDLQLTGRRRRRIQIKSHASVVRQLRLADFTTEAISFRIDRAVRSFVEDSTPADEYRLFTTFDPPDRSLTTFLMPDQSVPPLLPGLVTQRFRLDMTHIWPESERPAWAYLENVDREVFVAFCNRFVVETGCSQSSGYLRTPGALEYTLLALLHDRIGIGIWPNNNRDLADAAAHLIYAAMIARETSATYSQQQVIDTLALRVDYGRVEERFPVDERRLVSQSHVLDELIARIAVASRVTITGEPGCGKSWLLHQLTSRLRSESWIVATHYCFIDLLDNERARRAAVETVFGSIIAEILDVDPSLAADVAPRFAAGPRELERLLDSAAQAAPDRRIAIIVDGLDHVDRLDDHYKAGSAEDIVQELAGLRCPPGTIIVIGSQPGDHLAPFKDGAVEYRVHRWSQESVEALAGRMGIVEALRDGGLESDTDHVIQAIIDKAAGSPLYATYLARTAITLARQSAQVVPIADIAEYFATVPELGHDLEVYYGWLVGGLARDTGIVWITELLSLLDFPVSDDELKQIKPEFRHHITNVLSRLAPVLIEDVTQGGVRIYHESFQRYVRREMEGNPEVDIAAVLSPIIDWLDGREFFHDLRAFRSLFGLLHIAGRDIEIISRVADDFVVNAAIHGQPADAVRDNLALAGKAAAAQQNWPVLASLAEIARAADYLYNWRLIDHAIAEAYGRAYAVLFGAKSLSDRLLHDGRCTFPPRSGLVLCRLCSNDGITPPWTEYRSAHDRQLKTENTSYGAESDAAIGYARLIGRLHLSGREESIQQCIDWFRAPDHLPVHPHDVAFALLDVYGLDALKSVVESLSQSVGRSWARYALARIQTDPNEARALAEDALRDGLPQEDWRACLRMGANPLLFSWDVAQLYELTAKVVAPGIQHQESVLSQWLTMIHLAAARGDQVALAGTDICIPSDTWFHRWLKFCLIVARSTSNQDDLVVALQDLGREIEVFKGSPRVCDLYGLHGDIQSSFRETLSCLDDEHWTDALNALGQISSGTTTWLQGSRSGPLPLDVLLEMFLAVADTDSKRLAVSALGAELLAPEHRSGEFYDTHAQDHLLLVRLHAVAGKQDIAEQMWQVACRYLASYGWRKDITIYELLDPLEALASADPIRVRRCFRVVQPIVERILIHTDGRETSHAIHRWLDLAAKFHPAGALSYLARYEVARVPTFGSLDHVLPKALISLQGQLNPFLLTAGWLATGSEARSEISAAITACESVAQRNNKAGRAVWNAVVGCLNGDGSATPAELSSLVAESAARLGFSTSILLDSTEQVQTTTKDTSSNLESMPQRLGIDSHPILPEQASPLQIAHAFRRWCDSRREQADVGRVINAIGWRLTEMIESGDEISADIVIRRIARDLPRWDSDSILEDLAKGLAMRGAVKTAALASTLAYTRTTDGWRRFAGSKGESRFLFALNLDPFVAWLTLASEVAECIATGGDYGVTVHLIELLAAAGHSDDAFRAWDAACSAVTYRVPSIGSRDDVDPIYDDECETSAEMLVAAIIARMNHCLLHEKRLAFAGAALALKYAPSSFSAAIKFLSIRNIPSSTLISLLQVMEAWESEPYLATRALADELLAIANGELVSARILARSLLKRVGIPVSVASPLRLPLVPALSDKRIDTLVEHIGRYRIEPIKEIWPEFDRYIAGRVDLLLKSEDLKQRMQRALQRIDRDRKGRRLQVWLPVDEEIEHILQTTGAAARTALAQNGVIEPLLEEKIGIHLLGNFDIGVRLALSRVVRPAHIPHYSSLSVGSSKGDIIVVSDGEFADWIVVAHRETELVIGDEYDNPVDLRVNVCSGILFADEWRDDTGLPLGYGESSLWHSTLPSPVVFGPFQGPLVGFDIIRDPFGVVELLVPHPIVLFAGRLSLTAFDSGLTLVDSNGQPAVACRIWLERLIGEEDVDREHRVQGMELLLRPDVFEAVSARALKPAWYVTSVSKNDTDPD